jgi:tRNA U34 5-carboxymethylaminomethyl modifying enzyme MnmG/GidA
MYRMLNPRKGPAVTLPARAGTAAPLPGFMKKLWKCRKIFDQAGGKDAEFLLGKRSGVGVRTAAAQSTARRPSSSVLAPISAAHHLGRGVPHRGPAGRRRIELTVSLRKLGLPIRRLRPERRRAFSRGLDFSKMVLQPGDEGRGAFSFETRRKRAPRGLLSPYTPPGRPPHHQREPLATPIFAGVIEGVGPALLAPHRDKAWLRRQGTPTTLHRDHGSDTGSSMCRAFLLFAGGRAAPDDAH